MTWNYRVIKSVVDDPVGKADWFGVHEVHYVSNYGGEDYPNIRAWTINEIAPCDDSMEGLRSTFNLMMKALDKPVLDLEELRKQVIGRPNWKTLNTVIQNFQTLSHGWDGYDASPPLNGAIEQAILFVTAAESLAEPCEATLHADGAVIVEIDMGDQEVYELRFRGDGRIAYACDQAGIVPFEGTIPDVIREVLQRACDKQSARQAT